MTKSLGSEYASAEDAGFVVKYRASCYCKAVQIEGTSSVSFTTDGPLLGALGAPIVIFGPGKPGLCHQPDEYIDVSDLEKARRYYTALIKNFLL